MNRKIILLAFVGLALLILLIGALRLASMSKKYSRHEMRAALRKSLRFYFGIFVFAILIGMMFTFIDWEVSKRSASAVISLNFGEASVAENANKTRFNMNDITSSEVIERAIEKGALENVSVSQLKHCVRVAQTVQGDSYNEDSYHISTEFRLSFTADDNTEHLDAAAVVNLIAESYKDYYIEKYTENYQLLDMMIDPDTEFADMEYLDIAEYLENKSYVILDFLEGIRLANSSFVAHNGETTQSLSTEVSQFAKMKIGHSLRSYILENGVAKNRDIYRKRLGYRNKLFDYDMQKAKASFDTRNDAVRMYEESLMSVVLVPSWDDKGEYYMSRTKLGLDELSLQAQKFSNDVASLKDDIETNKMIIGKLSRAAKAGSAKNTDAMIREICTDIEDYALRAKRIVREYTENRLNGCISFSVHSWSIKSLCAEGLFVTLLWLICLFVFMISNRIENNISVEDTL